MPVQRKAKRLPRISTGLLIGLAIVVIAAGVVLAVSASGGQGARKAKLGAAAAASQTTTTTGAVTETYQAFPTKDPFAPLISPAPAAPPTTAPPGAGAPGNTPATTAAPGAHIALLDVFSDSGQAVARVRVNDTIFEKVAAGQAFGGNLKVISLNPSTDCGSFLFGDDQFRLCKGQEVVK